MREIVAALRKQQGAFSSLLDACTVAQWSLPSRCDGWSITDVAIHMIQSNDLAIASATGTLRVPAMLSRPAEPETERGTVDDLAELSVASARNMTPGEVLAEWHRSADTLAAVLERCDPSQRVQWLVGDLAARTLATTRLAETWIHTEDIAFGLGVACTHNPDLVHVARLAWRTLPYAFARAGRAAPGPVGFDLVGADGTSWRFGMEPEPPTVIRGTVDDLCQVAARRAAPEATALAGTGPDADSVLELVRTWA